MGEPMSFELLFPGSFPNGPGCVVKPNYAEILLLRGEEFVT